MNRDARGRRGGGIATRAAAALVVSLGLAGCWSRPPGIDDADLANVAAGDAWVYFREREVPRATARALAAEVADVRSRVAALLGQAPPRAELVVYAPSGPPTATDALVAQTLARFDRARGAVRFRYPLDEDDRGLARAQLLGTVAHEVAESTILAALECVDPYARWVHDGVADLCEHEVLAARDPAAAQALLERALDLLADRRARGITWLDLRGWRALAPFLVRSHVIVGPPNLSLEDLPASRARLAEARARGLAPAAALDELDQVLDHVEARRAQGLRPGEAPVDDPEILDYPYYLAAFALWLEVERRSPGVARRVVERLVERRAGGDLVLVAGEAEDALREALGAEGPALERVTLERVVEVLEAERRRLEP